MLHRHPIEAGLSHQERFGRFGIRGSVLGFFDPITRSTLFVTGESQLPQDKTLFIGGISPRIEATFQPTAIFRLFAGGGADICFNTVRYENGLAASSTSTSASTRPVRPRLDVGLLFDL